MIRIAQRVPRFRSAAAGLIATVVLSSCAGSTEDDDAAAGLTKVIVEPNSAAESAARARGLVVDSVDYGSFRMLVVDQRAAGGRLALAGLGLRPSDDMDRIHLDGVELDTRHAAEIEATLPAALRRDEMAQARAERRAPRPGLYLVQFIGPVRDEWLGDLVASGLEPVIYLPENAYVVRARGTAALTALAEESHVQYVGDFHPAYRLEPKLRGMGAGTVDVVVQIVDGPGAVADLADLRRLASDWVQEHAVLGFRNVEMAIDRALLPELAAKEYVFHVEERAHPVRFDEAQGQIVAGNVTGTQPSGPGYLQFLADRGFNHSQFGGFAVNVVDDATFLTGHPDLPATRIAFQQNPSGQTGVQGGHGYLNAGIIAGENTGTGAAFEDQRGLNYGLGIAPFARVGATAIFGNTAATSTAWESSAYGLGARVSSNSWGFNLFRYDSHAQEYDRIVRDAQTATGAQQLVVVFAAGNTGSAANTISSPATAKNVITVGASESVRTTGTDACGPDTWADSADDLTTFSGHGPVNAAGGDGRIKPDLVAPGTHIVGPIPQSSYDGSSVCTPYFPAGQTLYSWSTGTSHSTPAVAGAAALVYQDFVNKGRPAPSPAMVKAVLVNSATYLAGAGAADTLPSSGQGMGRMNLGRAFDVTSRVLVDQTRVFGSTGQTFTVAGTIQTAAQPFRVTLAWTDAPGATTGAPWVNNLDLEVTVNGTLYRGNVFSGAQSTTGGAADSKNNVESVFLPAGTTGTISVTVRAANIAGDGVPGNSDTTDQDFALVVYDAVEAPPAPAIGVSPPSLAFAAIAGAAAPPAQTIAVTNAGAGTLTFTTAASPTWLHVSPASGTAPASLSVSAATAGLSAGSYGGTVTVSASGATNTPLTVPVTLTVTAPSADLIVNGGLEGGTSPWILGSGTTGTGAFYSTGALPHGGSGYVVLGVNNSVVGVLAQTVTIPAGTAPTLTFWLNVTSDETFPLPFDTLIVEVTDPTGATVLSTLDVLSNANAGAAGAYVRKGPYNLSAFVGQTVVVAFVGRTDGSAPTSFRIDDVSLR